MLKDFFVSLIVSTTLSFIVFFTLDRVKEYWERKRFIKHKKESLEIMLRKEAERKKGNVQ